MRSAVPLVSLLITAVAGGALLVQRHGSGPGVWVIAVPLVVGLWIVAGVGLRPKR